MITTHQTLIGVLLISILVTLLLNTEVFGATCPSSTVEESLFLSKNPDAKVLLIYEKGNEPYEYVIQAMQIATESKFDPAVDKIQFYKLGEGYTFSLHSGKCVMAWGSLVPELFELLFGKSA